MQPKPAANPPNRPASDRPLRSITAGYDIDRWPFAVMIGSGGQQGISFTSQAVPLKTER